MYKWFEQIKNWITGILKSRIFVLILLFCIMSAGLIHRTFMLQIVNGQNYLNDYKLKIQKTKEVQGTRGRILDRNGVVLADNKLAYSVTIEDNGDYSDLKEKNQIINETIDRVIEIVESNGDSIISNFKIVLNDNDEYEYTMGEGPARLRFIADIMGFATIDKLSEEQKNYEAQDIIDYLCTHKTYGFGLDQNAMSKEEILKRINIRYAMSLNRFQKYVATTIASDVSEETTAAIMENIDTLQGVNIAEESLRVYNDSKYFASIIGYTGQISQTEYDSLDEKEQSQYSLTDIVGKAGLEQVMDSYLQGSKGEIKYYVNNVGKVIDMTQTKESGAGNDVYTTIDANLQKVAYDLIEEKLAGILLLKIENVMEYDRTQVGDDSDVVIPIGDVYSAFFTNEVLDMEHFEQEDAGATEQLVLNKFLGRKESVLQAVQEQLSSAEATAYQDCSEEMRVYQDYILSTLLTKDTKILQSDKIDKEDEGYLQWKNESISLYTYLNYAISKNWTDNSQFRKYLGNSEEYSNLSESYEGLVELIMAKLSMDSDFDKLIYREMILDGEITGRQICMMLYEQGILEYDESQYQSLDAGTVTAYDFIRGKIQSLDITPGQLGLEPCTGSVVMTDTNSGEVLACVSYPGYDNNRLANTMDSAYYSKLLNDEAAAPLFNNATQERTAPGSTYKPLVAIAGLTEGVIDLQTTTVCNGQYNKAYGSPKCWIYPGSHGALGVSGAIEHSCNIFFYEIGYRLGLTGEITNNTTTGQSEEIRSESFGLEKLEKYALQFGLGQPTGIEIPESAPKISDEDAIRSAIGQGTNNYTTAQLARYVSAIANKGMVYNLSLLDKVVSVDGELIKDYSPDVLNEITEVSPGTWKAVQDGMRAVISESRTYDSLGEFQMSGKTGTAQQSRTHANHGLFVGYAPSNDPEVGLAVRIKNGYQSAYASQIGRDLMRYYYGLADVSTLVTGSASQIMNVARTD